MRCAIEPAPAPPARVASVPPTHPGTVGERQLDVFVNREIADQIEALEDEADLLVADARPLGEIQVLRRVAVQRIAAAGGRIEQPDDRQQRRFAAARRAGDGDVFALVDLHMDAGQRMRLNLVGVEDLRKALNFDQRLIVVHPALLLVIF